MDNREPRFLTCYTASFRGNVADPFLAEKGFAGGLVVFAIPHYGVMFRCRASGSVIDLEFGAFFALLKFIRTNLGEQEIKAVKTLSSNPEFVFAFTGKSPHLVDNEERSRLLRDYGREFTLAVGYVKAIENPALSSPTEFPSLPQGAAIKIDTAAYNRKPAIKPFFRGIDL